jgi:mRNA interferase RelE/StbE
MHRVELSREAEKFLAKLQTRNHRLFARFVEAIEGISENPYSSPVLTGNLKGYYSSRVGDYRVVFEIEKEHLTVYVEKIEHRREVYR